jgi:quercetin dioxygenase-like cupin family protein
MAVAASLAPTQATTDTKVVGTEAIPWATFAPGIEVRMLRVGGESGTYTLMTRFGPGTVLPRHRHMGEVHAYTIQGRWYYREYDWVAEAGSYVYEPPNSVHTLTVPADNAGPTVVLFTIHSGLVLISDDGDLLTIEDAQSMSMLYRAALEAQGIPYPAGVLP